MEPFNNFEQAPRMFRGSEQNRTSELKRVSNFADYKTLPRYSDETSLLGVNEIFKSENAVVL